jgi:[ribosomal protein S18]-alanine N-acetyltransferase
VNCLPTAQALLYLAPTLMNWGVLTDAEQALPLYIRNQVALTTAQREQRMQNEPSAMHTLPGNTPSITMSSAPRSAVKPALNSALHPAFTPARLLPMRMDALTTVMAIERESYTWPWSEGSMREMLNTGNHCQCLWAMQDEGPDELLGYFVVMPGVDEVHLLNITVAPAHRGQGWARLMLDAVCDYARTRQVQWVWLEVRLSNGRAIEVYERYGFRRVGQRKGYYPVNGHQREDALLLSYHL